MTLNLTDSWISIKKKQIASGKKIPTQINFNLTTNDLEQIINQRQRFNRLNLSPELLAELRYYSLLQNQTTLELSLTFTTYYVRKQQKIAVIKSIIDLQGKISQQLCRSFLKKPRLLNDLVVSHYWLIGKICDRIHLKYKSKNSLLAWSLSLAIVLIIAPLFFYFLKLNFSPKLIILVAILFLLYLTINFIFKKYLASFLLQQLLFGFFSKNTYRRRLGWLLLQYFG
ncbi:conserved hypothetical protein [Hyella patelloides LEGE 07179]|uniref:Uncharacterized protein n=1 Tax=Hyella patelloides LEGE 07179 TaxID=945734 RepID=A0A563VLV9_9CYAN|nr:hypothetical protein [Hyella patelloides]VEP12401.1 conserved hypothetical protein [Hyella patelloides LEGE 07179]